MLARYGVLLLCDLCALLVSSIVGFVAWSRARTASTNYTVCFASTFAYALFPSALLMPSLKPLSLGFGLGAVRDFKTSVLLHQHLIPRGGRGQFRPQGRRGLFARDFRLHVGSRSGHGTSIPSLNAFYSKIVSLVGRAYSNLRNRVGGEPDDSLSQARLLARLRQMSSAFCSSDGLTVGQRIDGVRILGIWNSSLSSRSRACARCWRGTIRRLWLSWFTREHGFGTWCSSGMTACSLLNELRSGI